MKQTFDEGFKFCRNSTAFLTKKISQVMIFWSRSKRNSIISFCFSNHAEFICHLFFKVSHVVWEESLSFYFFCNVSEVDAWRYDLIGHGWWSWRLVLCDCIRVKWALDRFEFQFSSRSFWVRLWRLKWI